MYGGRGSEACICACVTKIFGEGGRGWLWEEEGASLGLLGPKRCHFLPLSCCWQLSDSSAPTALDRLLLPLTCACFLIAGELFMLDVSSSKLGTFTDGRYLDRHKEGQRKSRRGDVAGLCFHFMQVSVSLDSFNLCCHYVFAYLFSLHTLKWYRISIQEMVLNFCLLMREPL